MLLQEAGVEKELVNILCKMSAQHYLPILAHHRVTTEGLRHMTSSDLKKVAAFLLMAHVYQLPLMIPDQPFCFLFEESFCFVIYLHHQDHFQLILMEK